MSNLAIFLFIAFIYFRFVRPWEQEHGTFLSTSIFMLVFFSYVTSSLWM